MDAYSVHQVYVVAACVMAVAALIAIAPFAKRSGAPTPVLGFSIVAALVGILGFSLTEYAAGEASSPMVDVAIKYLRNVPIVSAVIYACLIQATYYSLPRNSARVRKTLKSAPFVICGGFLISGVAEAWQRPPMLEVGEPLSVWAVIYNGATVIPLAFYGAFAAYIFCRAVREPFAFANLRNRARRNLQNMCGAVVMGSFTALACSTFVWYCGRVLLPQKHLNNLAASMSHLQMAFIAILLLAVVVGIVCYCSQDEYEKVMEDLARIAEPVCDLTEILAAAPVSDSRVNKAYIYVKQATGDEFLGLSVADASRADDAFRAGAVMNVGWAHEAGGGYDRIQSSTCYTWRRCTMRRHRARRPCWIKVLLTDGNRVYERGWTRAAMPCTMLSLWSKIWTTQSVYRTSGGLVSGRNSRH